MAIATLKPNDRYAILGKTRSGKTALGMVLAGTFAMTLPEPWEVWWVDTKGDPKDIRALRQWGFRNAASKKDRTQTGGLKNALYYLIVPDDDDEMSVVNQVQELCRVAYERGNVIVVIDEYTQVVVSKRTAGKHLLNIFTRGGGKDVGIIGMTQEPVDVPRQLISQATHLVVFSLTYNYDIEYVKKIFPKYVPPIKVNQAHGFWWCWADGNGEWTFYPNQQLWYDDLMVSIPKNNYPQPT